MATQSKKTKASKANTTTAAATPAAAAKANTTTAAVKVVGIRPTKTRGYIAAQVIAKQGFTKVEFSTKAALSTVQQMQSAGTDANLEENNFHGKYAWQAINGFLSAAGVVCTINGVAVNAVPVKG